MSGLEILGAVASSIALAQAVKGTIKAVNLLREIRQIRQQCDDLKKEIVTIDGFILEAMRLTGLPSRPQPPPGTTQEHPMVSLAVQELEGILEALNLIVSKYSNERKWHERIARKMQWLTESKKIEELARKAQNTKLNLHLAITLRTSSSVDRIGTQQEVILHSIKQHTVYYVENTQQIPTGLPKGPLPGPVQAPALDPVERQVEEIKPEGDSCSETSEAPTPSTTESLQLSEFRSLSLAEESGGCAISIQEESYVSLSTIQPLGTRRCGQDCQCHCHRNLREDDSYPWMSAVLGSWHVRNQTVDRACELQCGLSMGPEFEYRPPRWLWLGVVPFGGYQGAQPVLTCSLRTPRIIGWKEIYWDIVKTPLILQRRIREGWAFFPDDTNEFGRGLIHRPSLRVHMKVDVGYFINLIFVHCPWIVRDDKVRHILAKTLSFVQGGRFMRRIHVAAKQGDTIEMRQALREHPEAIGEIDGCGFAPIHYAAMYGNVDVLEQLILAGANTSRRNFGTSTPLIIAALRGHEETVRILLQNQQCRRGVDLHNNFGRTALYMAVQEASLECVRMLLEAGASVEKRDFFDWTPLHYLALSKADQQTAHQIIRLLQGQHARLEARRDNGSTAALDAVMSNNVPVLRALVDAGASLNIVNTYSQNILNLAACRTDLEMMSYLAEHNLTLVDPRLRDINGFTPLGELGWVWEAEDWQLNSFERRPSLKEQEAFISLYFDLLSHYLLRHMSTLKQLLRAAERRDVSTSSERIAALIQKSDDTGRDDMVKWYRGILGNVGDGNWHQVVLDVQDEYDEAYEELGRAGVAKNKTLADPEVRAFF